MQFKSIKQFNFGSLFFYCLIVLLLLPLLAAFKPLLENGFINNLKRAILDPRFSASFKYGVLQAGASTLLAGILGLPAAFLIAKRKFFGKNLLASLTAVPFTVPPLIIAIAFVLFYGKEGWLNKVLIAIFHLKEAPVNFLYSFLGIVITHGFYNFPVVMSFVGNAWSSVPKRQEDSARLLGAKKARVFFSITLPSILPAIGAALSLVFLMCFYSFVIVLLFGGPGAATPEVELYRAARFEFDRPLASAFALAETIIAFFCLTIYAFFEKKAASDRQEYEYSPPIPFRTKKAALLAAIFCLVIVVFFVLPLLAILLESFIVRSTPGRSLYSLGAANYKSLFLRTGFIKTIFNTIGLGLLSAALASILGFIFFVRLKKTSSSFISRVLPLLPLAVSSVVLAFGWASLSGGFSVFALAAIHAFSAWPFSYRAMQSSIGRSDEASVKAAKALGSSNIGVIFRIRLPLALSSIATGFVLAFGMSAGDANAIIAAPAGSFSTLGLYIYRLAGSYRFNEACAAASILFFISVVLILLKEARHGLS